MSVALMATRGNVIQGGREYACLPVSNAVIHTAFNHDFSKYVANGEADRRVIEALGSVLDGQTDS
jgi:hypothetical protein